jgi:uncharacterized protein (TIGR00255 family)
MKSMTAYGRAEIDTPLGKWTVEISSVNRKSADIHISLPRHLLKWEFILRKWVAPHIHRGQMSVRGSLQKTTAPIAVDVNRLKGIKKTWDHIAAELGYDPNRTIDLRFLLEQAEELTLDEEAELEKQLKKTVDLALSDWKEMQVKEGNALKKDLIQRLDLLEGGLKKIVPLLPKAIEEFREKLKVKLDEICRDSIGNEERVLREAMVLAEKLDVSEELTRIQSHIDQFRSIIEGVKPAIGRTMDFLTQELHREVNTLGVKSSDLEIIRHVLEMKGEIEKIREQVQNIE